MLAENPLHVQFTQVLLRKIVGPGRTVSLDDFEIKTSEHTILHEGSAYQLCRSSPSPQAGEPVDSKKVNNDQSLITTEPHLPSHHILCKTLYLSCDPYMRCQFNKETGAEYLTGFQEGAPIYGFGVGEVVYSTHAEYPVGTLCGADAMNWPWQGYNIFGSEEKKEEKATKENSFKMPAILPPGITPENASITLGALGITGLTAYFGIAKEAQIVPGKSIVVVSSAAGATGSVVCQLAKILGAKQVIGVTSKKEKEDFLKNEIGVTPLNYKKYLDSSEPSGQVFSTREEREGNLAAALKASLSEPHDVMDIYFDNAGGSVSNAIIPCLAGNATVVLCGQISQYDLDLPYPPPIPPSMQETIKAKQIKRERYLVLKYAAEFPEVVPLLLKYWSEGKLINRETVLSGLEKAPLGFIGVMQGDNVGKEEKAEKQLFKEKKMESEILLRQLHSSQQCQTTNTAEGAEEGNVNYETLFHVHIVDTDNITDATMPLQRHLAKRCPLPLQLSSSGLLVQEVPLTKHFTLHGPLLNSSVLPSYADILAAAEGAEKSKTADSHDGINNTNGALQTLEEEEESSLLPLEGLNNALSSHQTVKASPHRFTELETFCRYDTALGDSFFKSYLHQDSPTVHQKKKARPFDVVLCLSRGVFDAVCQYYQLTDHSAGEGRNPIFSADRHLCTRGRNLFVLYISCDSRTARFCMLYQQLLETLLTCGGTGNDKQRIHQHWEATAVENITQFSRLRGVEVLYWTCLT